MSTIPYTLDGKNHVYRPDIFIPSRNKIIEVKSEYTYKLDYDKNWAKLHSCKALGYDVEIRVYNSKGELDTLCF